MRPGIPCNLAIPNKKRHRSVFNINASNNKVCYQKSKKKKVTAAQYISTPLAYPMVE